MALPAFTTRPSYQLPPGCDFKELRESGRHAIEALYEPNGEIFKEQFGRAVELASRDYTVLKERFVEEAERRGYLVEQDPFCTYSVCRYLIRCITHNTRHHRNIEFVYLYCDVFVAAILACPLTKENVYE